MINNNSNNNMTQQKVFVDTLKVLVSSSEKKILPCDEGLDNFYKTLIVLFGRACIMQQFSSNIIAEVCREYDKLDILKEKLEFLESSDDSTLSDKQVVTQYKELIEIIDKKIKLLKGKENVEFSEKVADKILIENLKLTTCTSSSIAQKLELLIAYDLNTMFKRGINSNPKNRLMDLSDFKHMHDLLLEKNVVQTFNIDFFEFTSRKTMQFLDYCYSNYTTLALIRLSDILVSNLRRALKLLKVIYEQNNNMNKEFSIDDISEIYKEYKNNNYPHAQEFIDTYNYIVYLNNLLCKIDETKKNDKFVNYLSKIEKDDIKLYSFFQSKFLNETNNQPLSDYVLMQEVDYMFLNKTYMTNNGIRNGMFDSINNRITLKSTKYEQDNIDELIEKVSKEIASTYLYIERLDINAYMEATRKKISDVYCLEAYEEFVIPNQQNGDEKIYFKPKKYRKILLSEDFINIFTCDITPISFLQSEKFILDTNYVFKYLLDENSVYQKFDLFLFLKSVIGLYFNEPDWTLDNTRESSVLSNNTINLFFSKFSEIFNSQGDIFNIIKSYSDELIEKGYITGLDDTSYPDALDSISTYTSTKNLFFDEYIDSIRRNRNRRTK